jgi:hypothetical protein
MRDRSVGRMTSKRKRGAIASLLVLVFLQVQGVASAGDRAVAWKPADYPMLRLDDRPVADWNVFVEGKKNNPLLIEMGKRYLLVDQVRRQIFELDPMKIEHKGTELYWDPADRPEKPLETAMWIVKDVGLAYRVNVKLVAENHVIDVQIPHPLDLRKVGP